MKVLVLCGALGVTAGVIGLVAYGPVELKPAGGPGALEPLAPPIAWSGAYGPDAAPDDIRGESQRIAEKLASEYPHAPDALAVLAGWYHSHGEADKEVEVWRRCLTLSPEWSDAHYGIGLIALRKGEFQAACDSLRRAAALAPADPRVPDLLAEALARLGQYDEAEAVLQRVLKTGMPTARTHVQLGQVHLEKGDYAQAARVFEALVKQAPQHAQGHYGLARAYLRQGRREEARRHMERFKELDARRLADEIRDANAYADRETCRAALIRTLERAAHAYGRFGDLGSAEEMWRRLCRLQPRDVRCRDALLRLYEDQGRQSDALAVAREMCEIEPDGAAHWYNVAVLSGLAGRRDAAIAAARRAVELDPQNGRYRAVLQTLQEGR